VLPFLFPKTADALADKLSEKVGAMLDPSKDKADWPFERQISHRILAGPRQQSPDTGDLASCALPETLPGRRVL